MPPKVRWTKLEKTLLWQALRAHRREAQRWNNIKYDLAFSAVFQQRTANSLRDKYWSCVAAGRIPNDLIDLDGDDLVDTVYSEDTDSDAGDDADDVAEHAEVVAGHGGLGEVAEPGEGDAVHGGVGELPVPARVAEFCAIVQQGWALVSSSRAQAQSACDASDTGMTALDEILQNP
ncbi:hypothetical protein FXO38_07024 [Capsicum annuum]|nr:hypothetical protein FXO37_15178 [Capsicum annuum]KAF3670548.1 hypothetical protein FXO38_07024 [Capsicum annuum]